MMNVIRFVTLGALVLTLSAVIASAQTVDVYGQTRIYDGDCATGVGVNEVTVLVYNQTHTIEYSTVTYTDEDFMNAHGLTSPDGIYYFHDIPEDDADWVEVIVPNDYVQATLPGNPNWNLNPRPLDDPFQPGEYYECILLLPDSPHTIGFWKHQAKVAVKGKGNAQVPEAELILLLEAVFDRFDGASYFPVENVSSVGGNPLEPEDALDTFELPNGGSSGMVNKAKKQLLALLLSIVAEDLSVYQVISEDDRTISEAIAFGADMIGPPSGAAVGTAKDALDEINNGNTVPAGWIPDVYGSIIYGNETADFGLAAELPSTTVLAGNYPNPFNPETTIQYALQSASTVKLSIYDVTGREIATLIDGWRDAGTHEVTFDGSRLASGVYIYRLSVEGFTASGKMLLIK